MEKGHLDFIGGMYSAPRKSPGAKQKVFDWKKAALLIREHCMIGGLLFIKQI